MTMTISEALSRLDHLTLYMGLGPDREAISLIRSRLEVSDEMASAVMDAYRSEVGTVGPLDLLPIDREAMKAALIAALGEK